MKLGGRNEPISRQLSGITQSCSTYRLQELYLSVLVPAQQSIYKEAFIYLFTVPLVLMLN